MSNAQCVDFDIKGTKGSRTRFVSREAKRGGRGEEKERGNHPRFLSWRGVESIKGKEEGGVCRGKRSRIK
jgi:hypothetical protein